MKRVVAAASAFVLAGNMVYACNSNDDGGTGGHAAACDDAGMADGSKSEGADAAGDGSPADASMVDGDDAGDAGAAPQPVTLNLCGTFDAMWPANLPREDATSWPTEFVDGANQGEGYLTLVYADCEIEDIFANVPLTDQGPWLTQLEEFEYQLFGCPTGGLDAGSVGFALVPPDLYGQPLTSTDLQRLSDWYLEAVIQAVTDRAVAQEPLPLDASYAPGLLTGDQIESIQQALTYAQTLYPNVVVSPSFSDPMCYAGDAGADGG